VFASFVFLLRFFGDFFLTLGWNFPFHQDFLAVVCIQVDLPTLDTLDSPILLREPDFAGFILFNQTPRYEQSFRWFSQIGSLQLRCPGRFTQA
jgi:hypothetical protein